MFFQKSVPASSRPEPQLMLLSFIIIWRDRKQEYIVFVSEEEKSEVKSQSFHGDPEHLTLVRRMAFEEIDRLQDLAIQALNEFAENAPK